MFNLYLVSHIQENNVLKEQLHAMIQENNILKRAVSIQHERQKEFEDKNQELHNLKQMVSQYQEQLRTLEVNLFALKLLSSLYGRDINLIDLYRSGERLPSIFYVILSSCNMILQPSLKVSRESFCCLGMMSSLLVLFAKLIMAFTFFYWMMGAPGSIMLPNKMKWKHVTIC